MIEFRKIFFWLQAVVQMATSLCHSLVRHTGRQHFRTIFCCALFMCSFSIIQAQQVVIKFHHIANGKPLVLSDSSYTNAFNETYQVSRLKYYVSNIGFDKSGSRNVELMDASAQDSIILHPGPGRYSTLNFTLGVDSALNCSGAQEGALDPLNGMFWTWNSGYILFKLEGYSSSSTADLQRIEQHVGGYRSPYNASKKIELKLPASLQVETGSVKVIDININIDHYWKSANDIKIADQALLMTPGPLAAKAAHNFAHMFSITRIR